MRASFKRKKILTKDAASRIKAALWEGMSQTEAAIHYGITQAAVSNIVRGLAHGDVPWPDGSSGAAPHYRKGPTESDPFSDRSKFEHILGDPKEGFVKPGEKDFTRPRQTPVSDVVVDPEIESKVWEALEQEALAEEEAFLKSISNISSSEGESLPPPTFVPKGAIKWDRIKRSQGTTFLFLYVETRLTGLVQERAKRIMGEVFAELPARYWNSVEATEAVIKEFIANDIPVEV